MQLSVYIDNICSRCIAQTLSQHTYIVDSGQYTLYSVQCSLYSVQCTLYTVQCTCKLSSNIHAQLTRGSTRSIDAGNTCLQSIHSIFVVHYILYSVQCTLYSVQCAVYTVQSQQESQVLPNKLHCVTQSQTVYCVTGVYSLRCIVYEVKFTMYSVRGIVQLYIV